MEKHLDAADRRLRTKRQPLKAKDYEIQPRDDAWIEFLLRHGNKLSILYLHKHTKAINRNFSKSNDRQGVLHHELKLLDRPKQQFDQNKRFLYRMLIHSASETAVKRLTQQGKFSEYWPTPNGWFDHQVLVSCVSASFELACVGTPWIFTPQHEVLEHAGRGLEIDIDGEKLIPDLVIMLSKGGNDLLLFVEVDRGTIPNASKDSRKSHAREIKKYKKLIQEGLYKDVFKVNCGAQAFIITSSAEKKQNIIDDVIAPIYNGPCSHILVHHIDGFGSKYFLPDPIDIRSIEWQLSGYDPFTLLK